MPSAAGTSTAMLYTDPGLGNDPVYLSKLNASNITFLKDKVDELVKRKLSLDWEKLRKEIKEFGLRHSTLSSCMPCESSSVIQSSTNGVEPFVVNEKFTRSETLC